MIHQILDSQQAPFVVIMAAMIFPLCITLVRESRKDKIPTADSCSYRNPREGLYVCKHPYNLSVSGYGTSPDKAYHDMIITHF